MVNQWFTIKKYYFLMVNHWFTIKVIKGAKCDSKLTVTVSFLSKFAKNIQYLPISDLPIRYLADPISDPISPIYRSHTGTDATLVSSCLF